MIQPRVEAMKHGIKCAELRGEFFEQCRATTTRQDCEALYGQTRGHLFDGPPHLPFVKELDCSGAAHED